MMKHENLSYHSFVKFDHFTFTVSRTTGLDMIRIVLELSNSKVGLFT